MYKRCVYCQPLCKTCWDDLGDNLLGDNEEVHIAINDRGYLEIDIKLYTGIWDERLNKFLTNNYEKNIKINYCPICGRKL